jgi:hypothetical protein
VEITLMVAGALINGVSTFDAVTTINSASPPGFMVKFREFVPAWTFTAVC